MVVGFVNAGIMTLKQSVGVILGANIGYHDYRADPASVRRRGQRQPVHGSAQAEESGVYHRAGRRNHYDDCKKSAVPAISRISSPVSVFCSSACRSWRARLHRWLICRSSRICSLLSPIRCSACWSARALPRSSSRPARVGWYSAGAVYHRCDHLFSCYPDHPRSEHRYLYHRIPVLGGRLQRMPAVPRWYTSTST